jgi:hypothetical protein
MSSMVLACHQRPRNPDLESRRSPRKTTRASWSKQSVVLIGHHAYARSGSGFFMEVGINWEATPTANPEMLEVSMSDSRTRITIAAAVLLAALATFAMVSSGQSTKATPSPPQPRPSPNAPNPNFPPGLNGPAVKGPDPKALDKQNQEELQNDIEKLYALAFVLREQMKMTNSSSTMSVTIVKQAQQIEKLAKEIKDRAKR